MIVDAQIHIWDADRPDRPWPRAGESGRTATAQRTVPMTATEVVAEMDAAGVDRAILVPPSWEGDRNDLALAAATAHPSRLAVMGRIPAEPAAPSLVARWRAQPGMLGARVILQSGSAWAEHGVDHWLWRAAADQGLPLMIAPSAKMPLVAAIARRYPDLPIIIDHMGARVHQTGASAFADIEQVLALSALPNVAVKATSLPSYSALPRPWPDVMPYVRRLFDAYGPERLFWGSDLSRLPCPYPDLVSVFANDLEWLTSADRVAVMGLSLLKWLDWR